MLFRPARLEFERPRLVAHEVQIGPRFGLRRVECERAFVIQDGTSKIVGAKIGVAEIVKQARIPLAALDQRFVARDRAREIARGIIRICLSECRIGIGLRRRCAESFRDQANRNEKSEKRRAHLRPDCR